MVAERGRQIDTGQIIIAQILLERKNDIYVMMVSWEHCVTSKDGYTPICAKPATLEKILDADHEIGRDQEERDALNPRIPVTYLGDSSTEVYAMATAEDPQ